jgi:hypothetical protein
LGGGRSQSGKAAAVILQREIKVGPGCHASEGDHRAHQRPQLGLEARGRAVDDVRDLDAGRPETVNRGRDR